MWEHVGTRFKCRIWFESVILAVFVSDFKVLKVHKICYSVCKSEFKMWICKNRRSRCSLRSDSAITNPCLHALKFRFTNSIALEICFVHFQNFWHQYSLTQNPLETSDSADSEMSAHTAKIMLKIIVAFVAFYFWRLYSGFRKVVFSCDYLAKQKFFAVS